MRTMSKTVRPLRCRGGRFSGQRGQATTEYITTTSVLLLGSLSILGAWTFSGPLFGALQAYIDYFSFSLSLGWF